MPCTTADRSSIFTRAAALFAALAVLSACEVNPVDPIDPDPDPVALPEVVAATVIDTAGSIFRSLGVTLDGAGRVEVFYAPTGGGTVFRMESDSAASHEILLPRLRAETEYEFAVRTFDATRTSDSIARGTFTTGGLPVELTEIEYSVEGSSTFPMLMVPFRSAGGWAGQVAVESDGAVVWYMESAGGTLVAAPVPGSHDMIFIENGFPNDQGRNGIVRVTPERQIAALLDREGGDFGHIHHDMTAVDGERVLFLAFDPRTVRDTLVNGEAVWEWNTTTGAVQKRWSSWDFIDWDTERDPDAAPTAWLHANSISIGPRGNVVVSFRTLGQVISIAPDFLSLDYRIGGPGATHALAPEDVFISQHCAWELPGGRLLLFDNRGAGPDDFSSRALELQIEADTAFMAHQYDPEPSISAPLRGGVYRLDNGNTVTIFPAMPFEVHESTPAGDRIWRFIGDQSFTSTFRAIPWMSIAGETEVAAMP